MKLTHRIALEQYCYVELEFNSLQEYKDLYPEAARVITETRAKLKKKAEPTPFQGNDFKDKGANEWAKNN